MQAIRMSLVNQVGTYNPAKAEGNFDARLARVMMLVVDDGLLAKGAPIKINL